VADLGVPLVEAPPVRPTPDERRAAADTLRTLPRGFLALHPGSGSAAKNWPPECYAALAQMASPGRPWLLVEGPADATACAALRSLPDARLARGLPLRVLGAVLAEAGAYVGNDSGVSHLAAAWGAPTVVLFGPTDPAVWAPIGPRTASVRAPAGNLANLEPGPVFDALLHLGELHAGLMRRRASRRPAG
jgi:heptosyltransferase-2